MRPTDILSLAASQIGVVEKPDNEVLYNTVYYGNRVNGSAYAWCCTFVWWLFYALGESKLFCNGGKTASCTALMNYHKGKGEFVTSGYRPGDLALFSWSGNKSVAQHIGVIESVSGSTLTTIEGNTSLSSDTNGGSVMRRVRNISLVIGAVRPAYEVQTVDKPVLRKGSKGDAVKTLQTRLNYLGYPCGAVDGDFGAKTDSAVKAFQKAAKIGVDGIVGAQTYKALDEAKPTGLLLELPNINRIEYVKGTEPTEKIDVAYKRIGCDIIINANFFGLASGNPTGYLMDEGKILSDWLLSKYGFEFVGKKKPVFTHWDKRTGADFLGGHPCLLKDGNINIDTTEAGFSASSTTRRARTAIGIKADGTFVVRCVKESEGLSITELAHCMIAIGCVNAVNLDGGGSTSWITPESKFITTRALDGFLAIWL